MHRRELRNKTDSSNEIVLFDDSFRNIFGYTEHLSERIFNFTASCETHTLNCDNMSCRIKKNVFFGSINIYFFKLSRVKKRSYFIYPLHKEHLNIKETFVNCKIIFFKYNVLNNINIFNKFIWPGCSGLMRVMKD